MSRVKEPIGILFDESSGSVEDLNLRIIDLARSYGARLGRLPGESNPDRQQFLSEMADEGVDFLCQHDDMDFAYFEIEDNSLFHRANVEGAKEQIEEDGGFITSKDQDEPPKGYRGLWLSINDHGNVTLYKRTSKGKDIEIWSVV